MKSMIKQFYFISELQKLVICRCIIIIIYYKAKQCKTAKPSGRSNKLSTANMVNSRAMLFREILTHITTVYLRAVKHVGGGSRQGVSVTQLQREYV